MTSTRAFSRTALLLATAGVGALALAGCSSSSGATAPTTVASAARGGGTNGSGGRPRVPGVSGTIAAIDGRTLQVQGRSAQTAVVYTGRTRITARVTTTASALAVGSCVSVRTASAAGTPSTGPTAANGGASAPGPLAASTVTILATGGCAEVTRGLDGGGAPDGGPRPAGGPSSFPSGAPTGGRPGAPGGAPGGGRFAGGFGAVGEVTAVSQGSFTIASTRPSVAAGGTPSARPTASASSTPVTVTYTGATVFLTTKPATAASIKVGGCLRATGTTDDTGKLTASTMLLSTPVDGSCTTGVRGG